MKTTQSITRNLPLDKDLHLKVEVTSSDNHLAYDYHVTRNFTKPKPLASNAVLQSPAIDNRALEIAASTLTSTNLNKEEQLPFKTRTPISYPNPAANYSTLHYEVKKEGPVKIFLLNFRGERLKTLKNTTQKKGVYSIRHSTLGLNEGIYYYRLLIRGAKETTKLIIAN